eukprot:TRINITY_DN3372_c0_g1_i1.p1 TRINITY_DN3372_c0_g1~~TRINITY_DN3372_c0_g1_i1.p1  ORF type:complete len:308 (-),score=75.23 TRINITY_DN3372_c0_g1_i1:44-967(-)
MRVEVLLCLSLLLGILILDIAIEYQVLSTTSLDTLKSVLNNTKAHIVYGSSVPFGLVNHFIPAVVGLLVLFSLFRLLYERRLVDLISLGLMFLSGFFLAQTLEPAEKALVSKSSFGDLKQLVSRIYECHLVLAFGVLSGVVLHLFATPPSPQSRLELIPVWIILGILSVGISFDLPLLLQYRKADLTPLFVFNTHLPTMWLYNILLPIFIGSVALLNFGRLIQEGGFLNFFNLLLLGSTVGGWMFFIDPLLKSLKEVKELETMKQIAVGHIAVVFSLLFYTLFCLLSSLTKKKSTTPSAPEVKKKAD